MGDLSLWGAQAWTPQDLYGLSPQLPDQSRAGAGIPGIARSAGPGVMDGLAAKAWSPENPLFWFAVILALTTGFAYSSAHLRVGNVHVGADLGDKK